MRKIYLICFFIIISLVMGCSEEQVKENIGIEQNKYDNNEYITDGGPDWGNIKSKVKPVVALPDEFGEPYPQPLANIGWEDSLHITEDGLNLYCVYVPADLFSFMYEGDSDLMKSGEYFRGPDFGMDLTTNPAGSEKWIHGDILFSSRTSTDEPFTQWNLSDMATPVFSEASMDVQLNDKGEVDIITYVTNNTENYGNDIMMIRNVHLNPNSLGKPISQSINKPDIREDNPHVRRLDDKHLVLFFVAIDKPGGEGKEDIWFSESFDDGSTWSEPISVKSINSESQEDMPFLHKDTDGSWWLYFAALSKSNQKLEIYRAKQLESGNWDSFGKRQLVVGAGNSLGIGEPTLTKNGDLSFALVYDAGENGTDKDRYDCDPWFLPRKR